MHIFRVRDRFYLLEVDGASGSCSESENWPSFPDLTPEALEVDAVSS